MVQEAVQRKQVAKWTLTLVLAVIALSLIGTAPQPAWA